MAKLRAAQCDYERHCNDVSTNSEVFHILKTSFSSGHYGTVGDEGLKEVI